MISGTPAVWPRERVVGEAVAMLASIAEVVWGVAVLGGCAALALMARRMDAHWCAKDGQAFTCRVRRLGPTGQPEGRWRDARAQVDGRNLRLDLRGFGPRGNPFAAHRVTGSIAARDRTSVYTIAGDTGYLLRVPTTSRAVATLDGLSAEAPPT